jgi:large subunit ribosomal protein L19
MNNRILSQIESEQFRKHPPFKVGDSVRVHTRIREGEKERIQIFSGIVIARKGAGLNQTFTVRRIASGVGVERVFPMHTPFIEKIEIERAGNVRRAKLYYLRQRVGKQAMRVAEAEEAQTAAPQAGSSPKSSGEPQPAQAR